MQSILKTSILLIIFSSSLMAQERHHRAQPFQFTDEVKAELKLNTEQVTQLDLLQTDVHKKMSTLHENTALTREEKKTTREAILLEKKASLSNILTSEQLGQLSILKQTKRQEHKEAWAKVDYKAMREDMKAYRKENIEPVMKAQRAKLENSLTAEEKNNITDIRSKIKDIRRAAKVQGRTRGENLERQGDDRSNKPAKHRRYQGDKQKSGGLMKWLNDNEEAYVLLQTITANHQAEIDQLFEETSSQQAQWQADKKAIKARYIPENLSPTPADKGVDRKPTDERLAKKQEKRTMAFLLM